MLFSELSEGEEKNSTLLFYGQGFLVMSCRPISDGEHEACGAIDRQTGRYSG
jgi:hypothetical protein